MYQFCTVDDVKAFCTGNPAWTGNDARIASLIPHATREIQQYCNRTFIKAERTEYINLPDSQGHHKLWLDEINVATSPAPSLKLNYGAIPDWSVPDLDPSMYRIDLRYGTITLFFATYHWREPLRVVYTAGYDVSNTGLVAVPDSVKLACALQTSANLERLLGKEFGQMDKTERKGGINTKLEQGFVKGLLPQARMILNDYRKLTLASELS